jgi:hypothetical protein
MAEFNVEHRYKIEAITYQKQTMGKAALSRLDFAPLNGGRKEFQSNSLIFTNKSVLYKVQITSTESFKEKKSRDPILFKCDRCGKEHFRPKNAVLVAIKRKSDIRYCSIRCRKYVPERPREIKKRETKNKKKICACVKCLKNVEVSVHCCPIRVKCPECLSENKSTLKLNNRICPSCGVKNCKNRICRWLFNSKFKPFIKLGGDLKKLGTEDILIEFKKIKDLIVGLYFNKNKSMPDLQKKFGMIPRNLHYLFKAFDLIPRNRSQAITTKRVFSPSSWNRKSISHETWDGRKVILRSSNEKNIAVSLDSEKVIYLVEPFIVPYIDYSGRRRNYVPDFYIPSRNLIIEAKGSYFVKDTDFLKAKACRENGYEYKYILDNIDTPI